MAPPLSSLLLMNEEDTFETGYRLCAVPLAAASNHATIKLARPLAGGRLALVDNKGCLRVLQAKTQAVLAVYQVFRGSFVEVEEAEATAAATGGRSHSRVKPPEPCALPWSDLTFVPTTTSSKSVISSSSSSSNDSATAVSLFFLLGEETNAVMYATLPPPLAKADEEAKDATTARNASFAYGSPILSLGKGRQSSAAAAAAARIRTIAVDATGSVLATGDDEGRLRVWALTGRSRYGRRSSSSSSSAANAAATAFEEMLLSGRGGNEEEGTGTTTTTTRRGSHVVEIGKAHQGPILSLTHGEALAGEEGHIITGSRDRAVKVWSWQLDAWGALTLRPQQTLLTEACDVRCLTAGAGLGLVLAGSNRGTLYAWSSLTSVLEYVAMCGDSALTVVAALAEEDEVGGEGTGEASIIATTDIGGVVRLYRPVGWEDEDDGEEEGSGEEEEREERNTWQPVAEAPLEGVAVGAFFFKGNGPGDGDLVVVTSTGMVMPWPVATLPRYPGDDNRVPPPPPQQQQQQVPPQSAAGAATATATTPYEEEEDQPRQGPPPSPSVLDATARFSSQRAWKRDSDALAAGWVPCQLGAPRLNSTAVLREALEKAQEAEFAAEAVDTETASVLEDAARAVNVDPRYRVYRDVVRRDAYHLPPPQTVTKQVDPRWQAKQMLRPTAQDFYTPDLEETNTTTAATTTTATRMYKPPQTAGAREGLGGPRGKEEKETLRSPYMALYRDTV